jgi:head-tail adaptor
MNYGRLDRRITVTQTGATNTGTGWTETTTTLGTMWASRKDVSDGEKVAAGTVMGTVAARFVVRSSTVTRQIKPKDRLTEGGLVFEVIGIKEMGRRDYLEITAEARRD